MSSKFALDVPQIMSSRPFKNGVRSLLHPSSVHCRHHFQRGKDLMIESSDGSGRALKAGQVMRDPGSPIPELIFDI